MRVQRGIISLYFGLHLFKTSAAQAGTVSVYSDPALTDVRPCAATCITRVPSYIGCPVSPILNRCFCRTDLTDIARTSLLSCVGLFCIGGESMDGMALTSIYTRYCNDVLAGVEAPATNSAQSTSGGSGDGGPVVQTSVETTVETITTKVESVVTRVTGTITTEVSNERTVVIYSTITTVLDENTIGSFLDQYGKDRSGSGGGLDKGYQVAIAVGVVAILIIILLLFMNKIRRKWFGYQGPYSDAPQPPMGGIEGTGQQNLGEQQFYNYNK